MELQKKHILLMCHSLGIDIHKAVFSDKKKDKAFPDDFYRNYFSASITHSDMPTIMDLVGMEYMTQREGTMVFHVTDNGIEAVKKFYQANVVYKPKTQRDMDYLRLKIEFYCWYRSYKFGEDNFKHIFSAYQDYYVKKWPVSHTTEDVLRKFKNELKRYLKACTTSSHS